MATSCVEYIDKETFEFMRKHNYLESQIKAVEQIYSINIMAAIKAIINSYRPYMGDMGEKITADISAKILKFQETPFEKRQQGFDGVYKDKGKIVIVEAKATITPGPSALHVSKFLDKSRMKQMSIQWVQSTITKMTNPNSAQYTANNSKLALEIANQLKINTTSVRRLLVHIHPLTHVTKIYEAQGTSDIWVEIDGYDEKQLVERLGYK